MNPLTIGAIGLVAYLLLKPRTATYNGAANGSAETNNLLSRLLNNMRGAQQQPQPKSSGGGGGGSLGSGGGASKPSGGGANTGSGTTSYGTGDEQQLAVDMGIPIRVPGGVFNPDGSFTPDTVNAYDPNAGFDPATDPFAGADNGTVGALPGTVSGSDLSGAPVFSDPTAPVFDPGPQPDFAGLPLQSTDPGWDLSPTYDPSFDSGGDWSMGDGSGYY